MEDKPLYIDVLWIVVLVLSLIFYVVSSSLVINGDLTAFEIMVSALIFFSMLILSTYILFRKINVNTCVWMGSFFLWVYMIFYNLELTILNKFGMGLIVLGISIEIIKKVLDICGIEFELLVKHKKKKRRTLNRGRR